MNVWIPYPKLTPSASIEERSRYIKAKYIANLFTIPLLEDDFYPSVGVNTEDSSVANELNKFDKDRKAHLDALNVLPSRIADYFLTIGVRSKVKTYIVLFFSFFIIYPTHFITMHSWETKLMGNLIHLHHLHQRFGKITMPTMVIL